MCVCNCADRRRCHHETWSKFNISGQSILLLAFCFLVQTHTHCDATVLKYRGESITRHFVFCYPCTSHAHAVCTHNKFFVQANAAAAAIILYTHTHWRQRFIFSFFLSLLPYRPKEKLLNYQCCYTTHITTTILVCYTLRIYFLTPKLYFDCKPIIGAGKMFWWSLSPK